MKAAPGILAIETSGNAGSVALLRGEEVLAERRFDAAVRGGVALHPGVEQVLRAGGGRMPEIVAAGIGPGSYTGARIALVFGRTFAFARGVHFTGVSALEAVALRVCPRGRAAVLMAAHAGRTYAAVYECADGSPPRCLREPALVPRDAFLASVGADVVVDIPPEASFASDVGRVAARRAAAGLIPEASAAVEPLYLQPPAPERA